MKLSRLINLGLGATLTFLVINAIVSYRNMVQLYENERWVSHTHQVLAELKETLSTLKDAETGQRGYLLTNNALYLEPYEAALTRINQQVNTLRQLTSDNPRQQQRIQTLDRSITTKLADLQRTISLKRTQGADAALQAVKTTRGKQIMDDLRRQVAEMEAEENQLLQQRSRVSRSSLGFTLLTFTLANVTGLLFLGLVYHLIQRNNLQRQRESEKQQQLLIQVTTSEELFRQLTETIQEVFWISEPTMGDVLYVSPAYETVWGRSREELSQNFLSWSQAIHPDDRERVGQAYLENALKGTYDEEYRIYRPDGTVRWIRDRGFPVQKEGVVVRITGIAEDITDRKASEAEIRQLNQTLEQRVKERTAQLLAANQQLQDVNDELGAFTYSVSHDLRAPLRTMQGFAQALLEDYSDRLDDAGKEYMGYVIESAVQMDSLITDLLAYSRLSRTQIELQPVDLNEVVTEALRQLKAQNQAGHVEIRVETPLPIVMAQRPILLQVLTNLLSNAVKFVPPSKPPIVQVWAEVGEPLPATQGATPNVATVRLSVSDNGIGIAPEHQDRIFRVFERLHGIEVYPGTGVGLAIVRKGVERMGGRSGVKSQVGQGSQFWIELLKTTN